MASVDIDDPSLIPHYGPVYESDIEADLEVDQLDSDSNDDDAVDPTKAGTSKNGTGRAGERVPGHTLLSAVRLDNMIQADGVTGNLALSKEGLFLLSVATEEFIKRLIQAGHREASAHRRNMINYNDMAATTQQYQEFMFLGDTIPACITLAEALILRQRKEREILEDNPAMAPSFRVPTPDAEPTMSDVPKPTKRSRGTNGKEKINGSASTGPQRASKKPSTAGQQMQSVDVESLPVDKEWDGDLASLGGESSNHHRSIHNEVSSASASSSIPPPLVNGHSSGISRSLTPPLTQNGSEHGAIPLQPQYPDSHSRPLTPPFHAHNDPAWSGQFTGPASGFLHGPVASFGRANQNPGRTIYSQNTSQHPD
ncbi:hypothetical protein BYT27DRAFT_7150188 [Phlegmacium glaucopus]|nr:hypothetical protein BYT27DRAFT_7150188 [Phlegmacium glaucopus]